MNGTTEIKLHENEAGELYFIIPDDVMERLQWQEGDDLEFVQVSDTSIKLIKSDK